MQIDQWTEIVGVDPSIQAVDDILGSPQPQIGGDFGRRALKSTFAALTSSGGCRAGVHQMEVWMPEYLGRGTRVRVFAGTDNYWYAATPRLLASVEKQLPDSRHTQF